jgi:hypothetical protein
MAGERLMIVEAPMLKRWLSYDDAVLYCQFCNHDGYTDWRMPTHSEWLNEMGATNCWHQERTISGIYHPVQWFVIPVRTVC